MNSQPSLSFIIPARNEALYIAGCLKSISEQNIIEDHEVIVVDNMSNDDTANIACSFGARVVREMKIGLSHSRMRGIQEAKGEILVFVDADTRLPKEWVTKMLRNFTKGDNIVAVSCGFSFYDGKFYENIGLSLMMLCNPFYNYILQLCNKPSVIYGSAYALKKDALLKAGGINMEFPFYAEDIALSHKMHTQGKIFYDPALTVKTSARRYHELGLIKTMYNYNYPMILLELGLYDRAKKLSQKGNI